MGNGKFKKGQVPWNKGKKHTPASIEKMRIANMGNKYSLGYKHTQDARRKMSEAKVGKHSSFKTEFKKGHGSGEHNVNWKGNKVTNQSIHWWVRTHFIKKGVCEHCHLERKTEWSNKDHKYDSKDRECWQELCRSCHQKYDYKNLDRTRTRN